MFFCPPRQILEWSTRRATFLDTEMRMKAKKPLSLENFNTLVLIIYILSGIKSNANYNLLDHFALLNVYKNSDVLDRLDNFDSLKIFI